MSYPFIYNYPDRYEYSPRCWDETPEGERIGIVKQMSIPYPYNPAWDSAKPECSCAKCNSSKFERCIIVIPNYWNFGMTIREMGHRELIVIDVVIILDQMKFPRIFDVYRYLLDWIGFPRNKLIDRVLAILIGKMENIDRMRAFPKERILYSAILKELEFKKCIVRYKSRIATEEDFGLRIINIYK